MVPTLYVDWKRLACGIMVILTVPNGCGASCAAKKITVVAEKLEEPKCEAPLLAKLVSKITEAGNEVLCLILLESIKADEKEAQSLTKEVVTTLMFLALEHGNQITFNALLRLDNADPNAIDPITNHTPAYAAVQHNCPYSLALLAGPYHAKIECKIKEYHVTPLYLAETMGYSRCKRILLESGAKRQKAYPSSIIVKRS